VIEDPDKENSLSGATLKAGYQSHYVVSTRAGKPCSDIEAEFTYDEIVINQETQVRGRGGGGEGEGEGRGGMGREGGGGGRGRRGRRREAK
jgi:hypothetical protein